jgi:alkylation response protein AidB-like acyl-CoA dehydrogenase
LAKELDARWSLCAGQPAAGPAYGHERSVGQFRWKLLYLRDHPIERVLRDVRVHQILEGTGDAADRQP